MVKAAFVERNNNNGAEHNGHAPPKKKKEEQFAGLSGDESKSNLIKGDSLVGNGKIHPLPADGAGKLALLTNGNQPAGKHHTLSDY